MGISGRSTKCVTTAAPAAGQGEKTHEPEKFTKIDGRWVSSNMKKWRRFGSMYVPFKRGVLDNRPFWFEDFPS
jgi:hypothetical protein